MTDTWLITGGCGFLGTNLIKKLLARRDGSSIRVFDNLSVGSREALREITPFSEGKSGDHSVSLFVGDITNQSELAEVAKGADVLVHLAAQSGVGPSVENPRHDMIQNVVGTFNALEAARLQKVERFVFASSGAPAGLVTPPIHEEVAPHPVSPYGSSKLAGEGYCSSYFHTFGIETAILRFGNVYGPYSGSKSSVVAKFIRQALDNETLEVYGDGSQTRDFVYVDDLTDAICAAATTNGIGGEAFQIATSSETTLSEMVEQLMQAFVDSGLEMPDVIYGPVRQGDVMRNYSDIRKAKTRLDWEPKVQLREGLAATLKWFLHKKDSGVTIQK